MSVSGSKGYRSGIVSIPNRVFIRNLDNRPGSYPPILRTGDYGKRSQPKRRFDDTCIMIFSTGSDIVYGKQVLSSSIYTNDFVATPNSGPTLSGSSRVLPFVSDHNISVDFNDESILLPYDDSRIFLENSSFYLTGTNPRTIAGFSTPLKDKIQIKIDLSTSTDKTLARYDDSIRSIEKRASTEFENQTLSGFCYYNFNLNRWEEPAINDSYDPGRQVYYFYHLMMENANVLKFDNTSVVVNSQTVRNNFKPYQFKMSNHSGHRADTYAGLTELGYNKIGQPTMMGTAPYKYWYAATASLYTKMDNYINHPFVLEKAVVEIPIVARRKNGSNFKESTNATSTSLKVDGANRDIDNYVFFMYRQDVDNTYGPSVSGKPYSLDDSGNPVASSQRFIVMSASVSFYNSNTFNTSVNGAISKDGLPHSPEFSYDFDMAVSASSNAGGLEKLYSGTLRLEMIPAVSSMQYVGSTRFPVAQSLSTWNGSSSQPRGSVMIQDFWPGGTTATSQSLMIAGNPVLTNYEGNSRIIYEKDSTPSGSIFRRKDIPLRTDPNTMVGNLGYRSIQRKDSKYESTNTYNNVDNVPNFFGFQASDIPSNVQSPYILFPDDKVIFGWDAGISSTETYHTGTISSVSNKSVFAGSTPDSAINILTGSKMVIKSGPASITLFGSMIKNRKEVLGELNQNLTSDAIHEIIKEKITDEFSIGTIQNYARTYTDRLITGSFFIPRLLRTGQVVRGISGYFSNDKNNKLYSSGAFTRFAAHECASERVYDTVMPYIFPFAIRSGFTVSTSGADITGFSSKTGGTVAQVISAAVSEWSDMEKRTAFPYHGLSPHDRGDTNSAYLWMTKPSGDIGWLRSNVSKYDANRLMFQVGYKYIRVPHGEITEINEAVYKGASSLRYGIYNIRKNRTFCIYRSDRYGQFRDMLEQRIDTKFYEPEMKVEKMAAAIKSGGPPLGSVGYSSPTSSPIHIRFVASDGTTPIDPYNTGCSNMSSEATSSLPYFEGDVRNMPRNADCPRYVSVPNVQFAKDTRFNTVGVGGNPSAQTIDFNKFNY